MQISIPAEHGSPIEFECADNLASYWVNREILQGNTYPHLPFVSDVRVIVDVGANCGATSVHFARHHPAAQVHAVEPGSEQRALLERNVRELPNVRVHPIGLGSTDGPALLYLGDGDTILASTIRRGVNLDESETIDVRHGGRWAAEHGIERIDLLKVDVEGAELDVVRSLEDLLPTVQVLYLEYDSRTARRALTSMVEPTHELFLGFMFLDQGECVYLRRDQAERAAAADYQRQRVEELLA